MSTKPAGRMRVVGQRLSHLATAMGWRLRQHFTAAADCCGTGIGPAGQQRTATTRGLCIHIRPGGAVHTILSS